jgi:hypothetical protein
VQGHNLAIFRDGPGAFLNGRVQVIEIALPTLFSQPSSKLLGYLTPFFLSRTFSQAPASSHPPPSSMPPF